MKKGSNHSKEAIQKIKSKLTGRFIGKKHHLWTENNPSYATIHIWIKTHYGKALKCEKCKCKDAKRYEWANISGKYKRDIKDYIQLCVSCHRLMDRGDHCRNGHKFTKKNTWLRKQNDLKHKNTYRVCKECQKNFTKKYQNKLKNI